MSAIFGELYAITHHQGFPGNFCSQFVNSLQQQINQQQIGVLFRQNGVSYLHKYLKHRKQSISTASTRYSLIALNKLGRRAGES